MASRFIFVCLMVIFAFPYFANSSASMTAPAAELQLDGTLYQKKSNWLLFVEADKASFKKGSVQLVLSRAKKKQFKNYLIEQSYVTVSGKKTSCTSKNICIKVESIAPTPYHPLTKGLGK